MQSLRKYYILNKIIIAAHRGASGEAPENTLIAYKKAIEVGIPAIEVDVHLTKDDFVVAFHDDNLARITKSNQLISESTYNDLLTVEIGTWFDPKFKNEQIPTLNQVLEVIHNKAYLILEMKPFAERPEQFVQNVINILDKYDYLDKTLLVSFDYNLLKLINITNSKLNIAAIKIPDSNLLPNDLKLLTNCDAVICSINELDDKISNNAKSNKIPIGVYDVDNAELFNKAMSFNVQGIGTNYPELIMKLSRELL